jgi:hypothetical protein
MTDPVAPNDPEAHDQEAQRSAEKDEEEFLEPAADPELHDEPEAPSSDEAEDKRG